MKNSICAHLVSAIVGILVALGVTQAGAAWAMSLDQQASFDIPAQPLPSALVAFSRQAGVQVVTATKDLEGYQSGEVKGRFALRDAITRLLGNTGLAFKVAGEGTVVVGRTESLSSVGDVRGSAIRSNGLMLAQASGISTADKVAQSSSENSEKDVPDKTAPNRAASDKAVPLEGIMVTAQKRSERLIDVPQAVTVLSADDLAKMGATQFRDIANAVPGLSLQTSGAGFSQITLRGVNAGYDIGPTVAVYVDEVPYGSSSAFAEGGATRFDMALFDLDRIEVLRGPQGTLYGASSIGGLIKYVTPKPSTQGFSSRATVGTAATFHGGVSYNGAAAINAPIADDVAVRASGFYSHDGGYIENLARGEKNVNRSGVYGGRLDLLFTPTNALSIRVGGFLQNISRDGEGTADYTFAGARPYGSLGQNRPFAEPFDQRFRLFSGTVTYDFGSVALTSISSYQTTQLETRLDVSGVYVPLLNGALGRSYSAVGVPDSSKTNKFTQEVRLAAEGSRPLEWVIGGFYTRETSEWDEEFTLRDQAGAPAPNDLFTFAASSRYKEYAAFGDLTWHLTNKFDVTGGLRYAHNDQEYTQFGSGLFVASRPTASSREGVVTYLANARYHFGDRATAYLRYATGYRPGGPNISANDPVTGLPLGSPTFEADRLKSYEGGFKAETADRRFGLDLAGYYIDWSNIQILAIRGGFAFRANAPGGATVRGTELTLTARPTRDFTVSGAFAYQDGHLSKADADLGGAKGERLPNTPRFTAAVNADYEIQNEGLRPTVGATLRYVSDRTTSFNKSASLPQYRLPDYTTVDLRTGIVFRSFNVQLYVHNLFDERGQLSNILPQFGSRIGILQPRTIGVNVTTRF